MDQKQCAEMLALVAQSAEVSRSVVVYKKQAETFSHRLIVFQSACNHFFEDSTRQDIPVHDMTKISAAQNAIEKSLQSFIELAESTLYLDLWDWPDWEAYFQKNDIFYNLLRDIITFSSLLHVPLPYSRIIDPWQDSVNVNVDWRSTMLEVKDACGSDHPTHEYLKSNPPPLPMHRQIDSKDLLTLFEIDTSYADSSDDEDDEVVDDEYASEHEDEDEKEQRKQREEEARRQKKIKNRGNFTSSVHVSTLKDSAVMLKKIGATYCRGGVGDEGVGHALLGLAVTAQHLKMDASPYILKPLGICTKGVGVTEEERSNDIESLQSRREKERGGSVEANSAYYNDDLDWKDRPVPRTLGLIFPLAPYGCLMNFLQEPPSSLFPKGCKDRSVPGRIKLSIMLDVCEGLEHLHRNGVVHGRLHSRNVLIFAGFRAKLVDFGISQFVSPECSDGDGLPGAKQGDGFDPRWRAPEDLFRAEYSATFPDDDNEPLDNNEREGSNFLSSLTKGILDLSNSRMITEQHSFALVTERSDIYAFGMLMYSIAVDGKRPFFNLPWDEAVVSTMKAGGRPSFPSWISDKDKLEGIIRIVDVESDEKTDDEVPCLIEECWRDLPRTRPKLPYVRGKLEERLGSVLKEYSCVVNDNMDARVADIEKKIADITKEVEEAQVKIDKGKVSIKEKEEEMEKVIKPVEKRALALKLEKAYPRLNEAIEKNEELKKNIKDLENEKASLLDTKSTNEQDMLARRKLLDKRDISSVTFSKQAFAKQFMEFTKPYALKHLRSCCSETDTLLESVAAEYQRDGVEGCVPIDSDMWMIVCGGDIFGRNSTYRPKISSLFGYEGPNDATKDGDQALSAGNSSNSPVKKKKEVIVTKFFDNEDYEAEVHEEVDRRSYLSKDRSASRSNIYFSRSDKVDHLNDVGPDKRGRSSGIEGSVINVNVRCDTEAQFHSEGFKPLNRYKDYDKKRKKVKCASHYLNIYELIEHDNTERMYVDELTPELQYLIAARGDVRDSNGMYIKSSSYSEEFIQDSLVAAGLEGSESSARSSPCHLAAALGHLYALKFLIDVHGVPSDTVDSNGWSSFTMACYMGHLPIARYLSERHRVDMERVDVDGLSPIHLATMRGHLPLLRYLMFRLRHKGDDYYFVDRDLGGGLLHWACMSTSSSQSLRSFDRVVSGHLDVVLYLLKEQNMDVDMPSKVDQSTPLMWACGATPSSMTKHSIVDTLVENGADLDAQDSDGNTCLFYAASSGDFLLLKTLIEEFNVDFRAENKKKQNASKVCSGKCATYLQQCMKNPPKKNNAFVRQRVKNRCVVSKKTAPKAIGTYLMKKSPSLLKGWQKRYFVLKDGFLTYYATKEDYLAEKPSKGSINLLQISMDDPKESVFLSGSNQNEINIRRTGDKNAEKGKSDAKTASKDRLFVLQAPDYSTAIAWLDILREWLSYLH